MERADRRDAKPVERRDKSVGNVALRKLDLRTGLQVVLANLVTLPRLASGV